MHIPLSNLAEEVLVIISALAAIGGVVYWVLLNKLEEVFMKKGECKEKHDMISVETKEYRESIKCDLKEIKEMIKEVQTRFYSFIETMAGRK